ncbi:hypothetical protein ACJX0J_021950, partial [Zea mays]
NDEDKIIPNLSLTQVKSSFSLIVQSIEIIMVKLLFNLPVLHDFSSLQDSTAETAFCFVFILVYCIRSGVTDA